MLEHEFGQVLQAEFNHFLIFKVDQFRYETFAEVLVRENRMSDDLTQDLWRLQNVLLQLHQVLAQMVQALVAVLWVLMDELNNNLAHVIRKDEILKEIRYLVHVVVR